MQSSFRITCADGHSMPVYTWIPANEIKAAVHIIHGMAEHGMRYAPVAEVLARQGFAVSANDNRGHGKATNLLGYAGPDFFNRQVADIDLLVTDLKKQFPGKRIFLLGHSMGSFISQRYFQLHGKNIDGLILSGTNGKPDMLLPAGMTIAKLQMKLFGDKHISRLLFFLAFATFNKAVKERRTGFDWLSRNNDIVNKYIADPLCGFKCTAAIWYDFFGGLQDIFAKENIAASPKNIPVYAFAGDKDPVGLYGKGFVELITRWQAAGIHNIEYRLYKDGRHEMLNEINRDDVIDGLVKWIDRHC